MFVVMKTPNGMWQINVFLIGFGRLKKINQRGKYECSLYFPCCPYIRTRFRKSKPDYSSSPYSSGEVNQAWPTGVTPIPRANTNWDAAPPIEMAEGASARYLVDKKHQTNGLVSYHTSSVVSAA